MRSDKLVKSHYASVEIPMTSRPKLPPGPVGIELLLELLNASEGLAARDASPPKVSDSLELEALPPVASEAQSAEAVELPGETTDDGENRFAAHIVRGMSKSKSC
jgi:hypothetical protein